VAAGGDGRVACSLLVQVNEMGASGAERLADRGLATKLHPHLIGLGLYVGTEVEQQRE